MTAASTVPERSSEVVFSWSSRCRSKTAPTSGGRAASASRNQVASESALTATAIDVPSRAAGPAGAS